MCIRRAVPFAVILVLAAAGCDDGREQAPAPEEDPPVSADEIRDPAPPTDTAAADPAADTAADTAGGPSPEPTAPSPRTRTLYTVQLGAFVQDGNARNLGRRLEEAGLPTWTPAARVRDRSFQRVRVGATGSYTRARELAGRLEDRFGTEFWIAPVPPDEEVPAGVVESTRSLLQQQG